MTTDDANDKAGLNAENLRERALELLHDLPDATGKQIDALTDLVERIENAFGGEVREWAHKAKCNLLTARSDFDYDQTLENLMDTGRHDQASAAIAFGISCAYRASCLDADEWAKQSADEEATQ